MNLYQVTITFDIKAKNFHDADRKAIRIHVKGITKSQGFDIDSSLIEENIDDGEQQTLMED